MGAAVAQARALLRGGEGGEGGEAGGGLFDAVEAAPPRKKAKGREVREEIEAEIAEIISASPSFDDPPDGPATDLYSGPTLPLPPLARRGRKEGHVGGVKAGRGRDAAAKSAQMKAKLASVASAVRSATSEEFHQPDPAPPKVKTKAKPKQKATVVSNGSHPPNLPAASRQIGSFKVSGEASGSVEKGDIVWAKVQRWPHFPSLVCPPCPLSCLQCSPRCRSP